MKSYILLASIALIAFAACKKDHSCSCKTAATIPGYAYVDTSFIVQLGKTKKKEAKAQCAAYEKSISFTDPGTGASLSVNTTCSLN